MTTYSRNPSLVTEFNGLRGRLDAVERKTMGTLTYTNTASRTVTTGTSLWSDTVLVPDDACVEFAATLLLSWSGATSLDATFSFYFDGVKATDWAIKSNSSGSGSIRLNSAAGTNAGAQGSAYPASFIIGSSIAPGSSGSCWSVDPGEYDVEIKCSSKTGTGTASVSNFCVAVRAS